MGDFHYPKYVLLLHCDGVNNSTAFTDNSPTPKTVTAGGNAKITTTGPVFGSGCATFDGAGDYLSVADHADLDLGNVFSISFRVKFSSYPTAVLTNQHLIDRWLSSASKRSYLITYEYVSAGVYRIIAYISSNGVSNSSAIYTWSATLGSWHHIEVGYDGSNLRMFIDGVNVATTAVSMTLFATDTALRMGDALTGGASLNGRMDEILIVKGAVLHTSDFTVPSAPYANDKYPTRGVLSLVGKSPSVKVGHAVTPGRGLLSLIGKQPSFSGVAITVTALRGVLSLTGKTPSVAMGRAVTPARGVLSLVGKTPSFTNRVLRAIQNHWVSTHYRCYLTGAADSLPDLELPISSFQTRMGASPFRVYLSVIVPGVDNYIDAINARPNGKLRIDRIYNYLDGSSSSFVMVTAPVDTIATNQGGKSGTTGTLSGYEAMAAITAQSIALSDPITRSSDNGGRRYRCRIDPRVRPLDTVTINGETFDVDQVIHIIDSKTAIMEIQELLA